MSFTSKLFVAVVVLAVVAWFGYQASNRGGMPAGGEPVSIGFIGPLSGDLASMGQNAKAGIEIAVEEINKAGGIGGRPLAVIYEDGQCSGKTASAAASKLINVDKVPVILGGACSSETLSFAAAAEQAKTVILSYCSSAPKISDAGDYIFRDYPSDIYQGAFGARYIFETLGKKKAAILYVKSDWGSGIKNVFVKAYKELGGSVVAEEGFDQVARDLRTQLTKIKAANPDILYFLSYTEGSIVGLKQAAELKLGVPMFGGDAWDDPKMYEGAGQAAEGVLFSVVTAPLSDAFKASMKAKTGSESIQACTPGAYDGVKILAGIMAEKGLDPTAIKNALYQVDYTGGVSAAHVAFDRNGDPVEANYVVRRVVNGKAEAVR